MSQKSSAPPRREVQFQSGDSFCSAWLYLPETAVGERVPMVVMGHGLGATRELRLAAYAERFVSAGMAVLAFTYRNLGDSGGEPRQVLSMPKQLADWDAAIEYVASLPEVDDKRIAVWGTSLGGGHAIAVAARHPELRAAVSQCPFTDGLKSANVLTPRELLQISGYVARDLFAAVRGKDPVCIPVAAAPGEVGLMQAPDALPGMLALVPPGHDFVNQAAARSLLSIVKYRPGRASRKIVPPILVCISKNDSVAPADVAEHYARQAPRGDVRFYDAGHFGFYVGAAFEELVADQLEFLVKHLEPAVAG
ncbi:MULTISPECIES: alpha/beta hydrolase [unclassified Rhodococcus (in: high G+C Gram-positive bacteria)]|uniref:alpha/beta hydrolase n=1 Tax=unclassified Rhodococcus (in: high G+C Gram-positive bacteria) TaxID=192944 RepID=UPI00163B5DEC|nr:MULTISPECIES: alpha/beta fold hydrolase [unclassified Rhodococcus (in: high G+C Gram-positive bacteria)]MBC2637853.1 alpha/beta fold hydrolase [Rhodococcus sp. 3A]MBC2897399.1 alpha/beta fold hydrolase [Rhodococcus sp. 4CII]